MEKAIVTGVTGQDAVYLVELPLAIGQVVHGIEWRASSFNIARRDPICENPPYAAAELYGNEIVANYRVELEAGICRTGDLVRDKLGSLRQGPAEANASNRRHTG